MFQEEEKALSQGLPVQRPDVDVARWDIHCEYGGLNWNFTSISHAICSS
jgi:hypothetical protein